MLLRDRDGNLHELRIDAGHKSAIGLLGYRDTINFSNKGHIGRLVPSIQFWVDPSFFPFRKAGEEIVTLLSLGEYLSGKEEFE